MKAKDLVDLVQTVVRRAIELKNKHTLAKDAPVNYVCVFSHDEEGYSNFLSAVDDLGYFKIAQETAMGQVFLIEPIDTPAGKFRLLKIRKPDRNRPELGDADFTVEDYSKFKKYHLVKRKWFSLIERENFEMIELKDKDFDVLAYFSHPILAEALKAES